MGVGCTDFFSVSVLHPPLPAVPKHLHHREGLSPCQCSCFCLSNASLLLGTLCHAHGGSTGDFCFADLALLLEKHYALERRSEVFSGFQLFCSSFRCWPNSAFYLQSVLVTVSCPILDLSLISVTIITTCLFQSESHQCSFSHEHLTSCTLFLNTLISISILIACPSLHLLHNQTCFVPLWGCHSIGNFSLSPHFLYNQSPRYKTSPPRPQNILYISYIWIKINVFYSVKFMILKDNGARN